MEKHGEMSMYLEDCGFCFQTTDPVINKEDDELLILQEDKTLAESNIGK